LWRRYTRSLNSALAAILAAIIALSLFSWYGAPRVVQATPIGPIKVTVASTPKLDCADGVYPPVIVTWLETGQALWVVHVKADFPVTATPSISPDGVRSEQPFDVTLSGARPPSSRSNKIVVTVVVPGSGYPGNNPSQSVTLTC
jgi:hypothetical protein